MAERLAPGDYDQLHHFVAAGVWDAAPLEKELLVQADKLVGGSDAVLVIDDTAVPKKGKPLRSVSLGRKRRNATITGTSSRASVSDTSVWQLAFLPSAEAYWRAGVAVEYRTARTKPEIALAEIDRVIATGVRFACVLARCRLWAERAVSPRPHAHAILLGRSVSLVT